MTEQIRAILWAQARSFRNFWPRTGLGTIAVSLVSSIWYGIYISAAIGLAFGLPQIPIRDLDRYLPIGLLSMLLFWQIFPLMTLSSGRSLELHKLLIYPIREKTLFVMEVFLRITTSPEMVIVLAGLIAGLWRHSGVAKAGAISLLLYLPVNLFLSLAIREFLRRSLARERLKALLLILILVISVLPSLIFSTSLGERVRPILAAAARVPGTPWFELSSLALGETIPAAFLLTCVWMGLAYWLARRAFAYAIFTDQTAFPPLAAHSRTVSSRAGILGQLPSMLFPDPLAALIEKEFHVLVRSPRFRLIFGMACLFSVVVFFPIAYGTHADSVMARNYLPAVNTYGLLLIGETLLWNTFGFDRQAAQLYFVCPVSLKTVFLSKNIVAVSLVAVMTMSIWLAGGLLRSFLSLQDLAGSVLLTAVLTVFFLAFGNFTSVWMPRPIDPNQAMKNQNSAKASALILLGAAMLAIPIGLAVAARWAFNAEWPFFAVLVVDLIAGIILYQVATDSAIERAERDRERMLHLLAGDSGPVSS